MPSCKIEFESELYTQQELEVQLENNLLSRAQNYSLIDMEHGGVLENNIAKAFHLSNIGADEYVAYPKQMTSLRKWSDGKDITVHERPYPGQENVSIVSFSMNREQQQNLKELSKKKVLAEKESAKVIETVLEKMQQVFPGLNYKIISASELVQEQHVPNINRIRAYVQNDMVYLVKERMDKDVTIEEMLHPFVISMSIENPELFRNLLSEGKRIAPEFFQQIFKSYSTTTAYKPADINREFVTQMLQRALSGELEETGYKSRSTNYFHDLIKKFFDYLAEMLQQMVHHIDPSGKSVLNVETLPSQLSFEDIAKILNTQDVTFHLNYNSYDKSYNLTTDAPDANADQEFADAAKYPPKKQLKMVTENLGEITKIEEDLIKNHPERYQQISAIQQLKEMSSWLQAKYQKSVDDMAAGKRGLETSGVTAIMGSSEFTGKSDYDMFKHFGTFMHEVIEKIQREINADPNSWNGVLTQERFNEYHASYVKKNPFEVEDLSKETMREMSQSILTILGGELYSESIIIPEFTLGSEYVDSQGVKKVLVGRLDLMVVDVNGNVKVVDFKTKKMHRLMLGIDGSEKIKDVDSALRELSTSRSTITQVKNTLEEFHASIRNVYDNWTLQLMIYNQMLRQWNIVPGKSEIIAVLYQADKDKKYQGTHTVKFVDDFYAYAEAIMETGTGAVSAYKGTKEMARLAFNKILAKAIPVSAEQQAMAESTRETPMDMTPTEYDNFTKNLTERAEADLKDAYARRKELENFPENEEEIKTLNARITTLKTFQKALLIGDDVLSSSKLIVLMGQLNTDIKTLHSAWNTVDKTEISLANPDGSIKSDAAIIEQKLKIRDRKMETLYKMLNNIGPTMQLLDKQMVQAINDGSLTFNSPAYKNVQEMVQSYESMEMEYRDYTVDVWVRIIQQIFPNESLKRTRDMMSEAIGPQIASVERDIKKLKEQGGMGMFGNLKLKWVSLINKDAFEKAKDELAPDSKKSLDMIMVLEQKLKALMQMRDMGFTTTTENLKKYIKAVTDPDSIMYVGQEKDTLMNILGMNLNGFIASAGNSDLGISAFSNWLKGVQNNGQLTFMNEMNSSGMQDLLNKFRDSVKSKERMNELLTERRVGVRLDDDGNEIAGSSYMYFVKPTSEAFDKEIRLYKQKSYFKEKQIIAHKAEYRNTPGERSANDKEVYEFRLAELLREKDDLETKYLAWSRKNTSLPFIDRYYQLQLMLPKEIREQLEVLHSKREAISDQYGYANDEMISETDSMEIGEISVKIKRLRNTLTSEQQKMVIDEMEEMFDSTINQSQFDIIYAQKKLEYQNNPEKLEKWEKANIIKVPNDAFYDERTALFERMDAIRGIGDEVRKALTERRAKILKPHKLEDRTLNPTYLNAQERAELDAIEKEISDIDAEKEAAGGSKYSPQEARELKDLSLQLADISTKQLNAIYQEKKIEMYNNLLRKKSIMLQAYETEHEAELDGVDEMLLAKLNSDSLASAQAFKTAEIEFREWYDANHNSKYVSIMTKASEVKFAYPKPYLYDTVPTQDKHILERPSYKWNIKKISEKAKNPLFVQMKDGTPMPKGLRYDSEGNIEIDPATYVKGSTAINKKYIDLMGNKEGFAFYNLIVKQYMERQRIIGNKNGYKLPAIKGTMLENFIGKEFVKGMKSNYQTFMDTNLNLGVSQEDLRSNEYDDSKLKVQLVNNEQYEEGMQGDDGINAVFSWLYESHINKAMSDAAPTSQHIINGLRANIISMKDGLRAVGDEKQRKKIHDLENALEIIEFEHNKYITGKTETQENRAFKKAVGIMFQLASFGRLGFDLTSQFKNYASGNLQAFLASDKSGHYGPEDLLFAKLQLTKKDGFIRKYIEDWGKVGNLSKETMMYRMFNPLQKDYQKYLAMTTDSKSRRVLEKVTNLKELAFILQEKGDTEIGMTVWLATMNSHKYLVTELVDGKQVPKLDAEGKHIMVNALEAYEMVGGQLLIREDVAYTKNDEASLRRIVLSEMRRAQGNYAKDDMTQMEQGVMMKMMIFFKKYLIPMVTNRLGYLRPNWEGEEAAMGYWRAMFAINKYYNTGEFAKHLLFGGFGHGLVQKIGKGSEIKEGSFYAKKAAHASRDFYAGLILMSLSMLLVALVKRHKDDDEEIGMVEGNMIRLIWGVTQETNSMMPVPGIGSFDEYIRNFSNITSLVNEATKIAKTVNHTMAMGVIAAYGFEEPDVDINPIANTIYNSNVYQRRVGPFEKGTPKLYKDLYDLTGAKNIHDMIWPEYKIGQIKKNQ